jgi:RND family efflux transporter MFP subunit
MKRVFYLVITAAALYGCNSKNENTRTSQNDTIAVSVTEVKCEIIETNLRYSGTVEPSQTIPLTFQASGIVESVLVDAGDEVKKGQLLASVEKTNLQNLYDINLAKYNQAKDAYNRLKTVYEKGSLPEIKWIETETNLEQAQSSLAVSKKNLSNCEMRAPQNGIVGKRNVEPGMSSINISSSPIELVEIKTVYVKISVPENEIAKIVKGEKAEFSVSALNNKTFEGKVSNISPVADAISRTYEVKILVQNTSGDLKPGMVCDVNLNIRSQKELTIIPYQCVTKDLNDVAYVFVVDKKTNRVNRQVVQTGSYFNNNLEILKGIVAGQTVVKEGKEKLSDNSLIRY